MFPYSFNYQKITTCDIVNGKGIGVVLWVSGCDIKCKGCHNKETWDEHSGKIFNDKTFETLCNAIKDDRCDRFTVSGGHPLMPCNVFGVTEVCKKVKKLYPEKKIWLYTGYIFESILKYDILKYVDVVVDGRFDHENRDVSLPFRGSSNQRIIDVKKSLDSGNTVIYTE